MTDPLNALREPITPVDPDPAFAVELRSRLERALIAPEGAPMTTTERAADVPLRSLTPYLGFDDGHRALDWYVDAFGARQRGKPYLMLDGGIGHAELVIGDSVLMLAGGPPGGSAPQPVAGFRAFLHLQVPDPDAVVRRAVELGAELERPVADQPYGRTGVVIDPFGHRWMIQAAAPTSRHGDLAYLTHAVADTERACAFYSAVLGWTFSPGRIEDGWQIEGTYPPAGMHGSADRAGIEPVYQVDDLSIALAAVRDHGGQAGEPQQQPYGRIAACTDNQGVPFQLLQP